MTIENSRSVLSIVGAAMDCTEAVYSNDYYDLMIEYSAGGNLQQLNPCYQDINQEFFISYWNREGLPLFNIRNYTYTTIPKLLTTLDEQAMEASNILQIQNQPTLSLKGQGVLVGIIDTGERVMIMSDVPFLKSRRIRL